MGHEIDIKRFLKEPTLLIELCREIIDNLDVKKDPEAEEKETQLREISRTIERLDKAGVQIPEVLRGEKTRLAAALGSNAEASQILNQFIAGFEGILKDLKAHCNRGKNHEGAKKLRCRGFSSNRTSNKVLRENIIRALQKLGGQAARANIFKEMAHQLDGKLLPGDLELHGRSNKYEWMYRSEWECTNMRKDGLVRTDSPRGIWELIEDQQ